MAGGTAVDMLTVVSPAMLCPPVLTHFMIVAPTGG